LGNVALEDGSAARVLSRLRLVRLSPFAGIVPATSTSWRVGTRLHTSGATEPANDWATRTASPANPADSSAAGRAITTTSCRRPRSSASTRCQYQPTSPAPWMRTYVAIAGSVVGPGPPGSMTVGQRACDQGLEAGAIVDADRALADAAVAADDHGL